MSAAAGGEGGEIVLDVEDLTTFFTFFASWAGATLGDLEASNSLCLTSGVCERCASDE
jgi:hypothetical protein